MPEELAFQVSNATSCIIVFFAVCVIAVSVMVLSSKHYDDRTG